MPLTWACTHCTLVNHRTKPTCSICGAENPLRQPQFESSFSTRMDNEVQRDRNDELLPARHTWESRVARRNAMRAERRAADADAEEDLERQSAQREQQRHEAARLLEEMEAEMGMPQAEAESMEQHEASLNLALQLEMEQMPCRCNTTLLPSNRDMQSMLQMPALPGAHARAPSTTGPLTGK